MLTTQAPTPKAVLVGVQLQGVSDVAHAADLAELGRLVHTLGYEVVGTVSQKREGLASGTVLGKGKLKELAQLTGGTGEIPSSAKDAKSKAKEAWEAEEEEAEEDLEPAPVVDEAAVAQRATVVVVDHELSPNQARNLEKATGAQVLDRTGVIVDIFHRHAKSREARAQVEIARLTYVAPRLRESTGGCAS
jgi:GTP-binding protein HflX